MSWPKIERSRASKHSFASSDWLELLTEHRRALITAAVTGGVDVPGAAS